MPDYNPHLAAMDARSMEQRIRDGYYVNPIAYAPHSDEVMSWYNTTQDKIEAEFKRDAINELGLIPYTVQADELYTKALEERTRGHLAVYERLQELTEESQSQNFYSLISKRYRNTFPADTPENRKKRQAHQSTIFDRFKVDALKSVGLYNHPKADKAFTIAWDRGSDGLSEIYSYLEELASLLLDD